MSRWICMNKDMPENASRCFCLHFFAAKYSPFFIADFLLHVKNDDKNNIFVMPIIGKEERRI